MKSKLFMVLAIMVMVGFTSQAQTVTFDASKSELKWNGKKVTGEHYGKVTLKEGNLELKNKKVVGGKFVIDMNTITCDDIPAGDVNGKLVGHLKSDDFFGVANHPHAVLELVTSTPLKDGKAKVKGKLTIKGKTHPIEFEATQTSSNYKALITVDRSKYDVKYGSGKFFKGLGDNLIYDNFTLDVNLVTEK